MHKLLERYMGKLYVLKIRIEIGSERGCAGSKHPAEMNVRDHAMKEMSGM